MEHSENSLSGSEIRVILATVAELGCVSYTCMCCCVVDVQRAVSRHTCMCCCVVDVQRAVSRHTCMCCCVVDVQRAVSRHRSQMCSLWLIQHMP